MSVPQLQTVLLHLFVFLCPNTCKSLYIPSRHTCLFILIISYLVTMTKVAASCLGFKAIEGLTYSSAELKASRGFDSIEQLVPHLLRVTKLWQLEKVHASASGRETLQVSASVMDAKGWVQLLEA